MGEMRQFPDRDEPFDPRRAALTHAGIASRVAEENTDVQSVEAYARNVTLGELASAVACGLVYVGDRIAAASERPVALQLVLPTAEAVATWRSLEPEPEPMAAKDVRALTPCTLELDGERHELAAGDSFKLVVR